MVGVYSTSNKAASSCHIFHQTEDERSSAKGIVLGNNMLLPLQVRGYQLDPGATQK